MPTIRPLRRALDVDPYNYQWGAKGPAHGGTATVCEAGPVGFRHKDVKGEHVKTVRCNRPASHPGAHSWGTGRQSDVISWTDADVVR